MKLPVFVVAIALFLSANNCEADQNLRDKNWLHPDQKTCQIHNGTWQEIDGIDVCKVNWYNAFTICKNSGAKLPKVKQLRQTFNSCKNGCERLGFIQRQYWSIEPHSSLSAFAWGFDLAKGETIYSVKSKKKFIRCKR